MTKISFALFIGALVFAPLAFGTVEDWSLFVLQLLVALAFFTYLTTLKKSKESIYAVPGLLPLFLLVGLMILQVVPLPPTIIKVLSPQTVAAYKPVYDMLAGERWMVLSVYPKGTILEGLRILTYIVFYILSIQVLSSGERLRKALGIIAWLSIIIAFFAILQKVSSSDMIYWFRKSPVGASSMGPWVYRAQYCGFIEIVTPLVLALALYYRPFHASEESWRARIAAFFAKESSNYYILLGFGVFLLTVSVFISLSRGGIIAVSLSLLLFFVLLSWRDAKYSTLFYVGIVTCFILATAWFGWEQIVARFESAITSSGSIDIGRIPIWQDSWPIVKDFWLLGSGFGSYISVFPRYRTIPGDAIYEHAHNDYLELLTDGGIISFLLVSWFMLSVFLAGWKMLKKRRDRYSILLIIGAIAGIAATLIHSISDFNLHNAADGLYFFFACAVLVSAGHTRFHYQMNATLLAKSKWMTRNRMMFFGGIFFCLVLAVQGGMLLAKIEYHSVKDIYLNRLLSEQHLQNISNVLRSAEKYDPFEPSYSFLQGETQKYLKNPEKALASYIAAGLKNPLDGSFLQTIALMLPKDRAADADLLLQKGTESTIDKDLLMLTQVQWLLKNEQREKAIGILKTRLAEKSDLVPVVLQLIQSYSFTVEEIAAILPRDVKSWLRCADFLKKLGNTAESAYFWEHALDFLDLEKVIQPDWFNQLYTYYISQKDEPRALEILRLAITKVPTNPRFHELLGDYYAREGIGYRAQEEYQQALLIEPMNDTLRRKLNQLEGKKSQ